MCIRDSVIVNEPALRRSEVHGTEFIHIFAKAGIMAAVRTCNHQIGRHQTDVYKGQVQYRTLMAENPEKAMMLAVKGMLPGNSLGASALKRLRVYKGSEHGHAAQKPEAYTL